MILQVRYWPLLSLYWLVKGVHSQVECSELAATVSQSSALSIINATVVAAQSLNLTAVKVTNNVPICRVQGKIAYGLNNSIGIETWLPEQWNGRYLVVGNGGLAGDISYADMMSRLNEGYAVAAGDSGHLLANNGNGTTASGQYIPFLNDKEQTTMWIRNSIATLTPPTRDLTAMYYGRTPEYSYYTGCSTGGAQGFALAQYHPDLFDGISAGCPGNWYSHLILSFLWNYLHSRNDSFLNQNTLSFITNRTLDACDELDGKADRLINDPRQCHFNITTLQCAPGESSVSNNKTQCLTPAQISTAQAIYDGPRNSTSSTQIYPGFNIGSESSWLYQETFLSTDYTFPILQNLVFNNLSYDPHNFDFDTDVLSVNASASPYIDSISPDLSAFKARGGKLVVMQGWSDPFNAATWPITHMNMIDDFLFTNGQGRASEFMQLFMIPGGGHCGSSPAYPYVGANWHALEVLQSWVENGTVPAEMLATDPADGSEMNRTVLPEPLVRP